VKTVLQIPAWLGLKGVSSFTSPYYFWEGYCEAVVIRALCYKPQFNSRIASFLKNGIDSIPVEVGYKKIKSTN